MKCPQKPVTVGLEYLKRFPKSKSVKKLKCDLVRNLILERRLDLAKQFYDELDSLNNISKAWIAASAARACDKVRGHGNLSDEDAQQIAALYEQFKRESLQALTAYRKSDSFSSKRVMQSKYLVYFADEEGFKEIFRELEQVSH